MFMIQDSETRQLSPGGFHMIDTWKCGTWRTDQGRQYQNVGAIKRSLRGMLRKTGRKRIPRQWEIVEVKSVRTRTKSIDLPANQAVLTDPLAAALDKKFGRRRSR